MQKEINHLCGGVLQAWLDRWFDRGCLQQNCFHGTAIKCFHCYHQQFPTVFYSVFITTIIIAGCKHEWPSGGGVCGDRKQDSILLVGNDGTNGNGGNIYGSDQRWADAGSGSHLHQFLVVIIIVWAQQLSLFEFSIILLHVFDLKKMEQMFGEGTRFYSQKQRMMLNKLKRFFFKRKY